MIYILSRKEINDFESDIVQQGKELLMIELEHLVRMEVLQEPGYIAYLENMNDISPMTNLGKLCG